MMKKVILDFYDVCDELMEEKMLEKGTDGAVSLADTEENKAKGVKVLVHEYLARKLNFPASYGMNLDALYDCLTDISEPTAIGFFIPTVEFDELSIDLMMYLDQVRKVFLEAETDNSDFLAVITMEGNGAEPEYGDPDEELASIMKDVMKGTIQ